MTKLLKAGLFRLKKDISFWLFVFLTIVIALFRIYRSSPDVTLNNVLYDYILYIGFLIAIFVSLFVGKEHSEKIIRNKIIVGHNRTSIYISKLIISICVSILCEVIYMAVMLIASNFIYKDFQMQASQLIMIMLNILLIIIVYCSIFNFITMITSEITIAVVINIIIFFTMFVAEMVVSQTASATKYIINSSYDINGVETIISKELNPNYPGDDKVKLAKTIELILPTGQAQSLLSSAFTDPDVIKHRIYTKEEVEEKVQDLYKMPIYSLILIGVINAIGIYAFSIKELK